MAQDLEKTFEECKKKLKERIRREKLLVERGQKKEIRDHYGPIKEGQREKVSDMQIPGQSTRETGIAPEFQITAQASIPQHAGDFCGKIVPLLSRDVKGQRCFWEAF